MHGTETALNGNVTLIKNGVPDGASHIRYLFRYVSTNSSAQPYVQVEYNNNGTIKNSNYQTPSYVNNKFGFWLVGYDGGVKLFSKEISILKNIFSTIDSMPMRKNEMSSKTSKCN